jgi:hypothetical protein
MRGAGRTKEHTEPWVTRRFLLSASRFDLLRFPLVVSPQDKPDLLLTMNGVEVGVEITEVVPPSYAEADAIARKHYPTAEVDRSIFRWGAKFTTQQIHDHLSNPSRPMGPGWMGDSVESEWAAANSEAIVAKTHKLSSSGYGVHAENWLAAYSSSPGPALDLAIGVQKLDRLRAEPGRVGFDRVLLLTDTAAVHLSRDAPAAFASDIEDPSNTSLERTHGR